VNGHDVQTLVGCFAADCVIHTPAHPSRAFVGGDLVHSTWARIFAPPPDVRASILRLAAQRPRVWSEWELKGARTDGSEFLMRGVLIFEVPSPTSITAATFYLEPVEHVSGTVDQAVRRATGEPSHSKEQS